MGLAIALALLCVWTVAALFIGAAALLVVTAIELWQTATERRAR